MNILFEQSDILNMPIEAMVFDADKEKFPVLRHWHYFMEIIYVYKGNVVFESENRVYHLHPGELAIFHPKVIHSIESEDDTLPVYALLKFDINRLRITSDYSPRLGDVFRSAQDNENAPLVITKKQCDDIEAEKLIGECINEISSRQYSYGSMLDANVYILLTRIIRLWMEMGFIIEQKSALALSDNPIYTITEYIDAHSSENLLITDLAQMCGMSYSNFARSFKMIYRQSCKRFINFIRISKAADYLIFTDYDLNYISQETGFSDCSHFIKTFKEIKGITPKQFRLQSAKR